MDCPSISLIVPTVSRPTLRRLLEEALPQFGPHDQAVVIGDGYQPEAQSMVRDLRPQVIYYEFGPTRDWGHSQRNLAMPLSKGGYLFNLDDDDRCAPWAFETIRKLAQEYPGRPLMFTLYSPSGEVWPKKRVIEEFNVGTQMFVVPNDPRRLGTWGSRHPGDYDFVRSTLDLYPEKDEALLWRDEWLALYGQSPVPEEREALDAWVWGSPSDIPKGCQRLDDLS